MALLQKLDSELYRINSKQQEESMDKTRANSHTSTLFHYTKSVKTLLTILKEGLRFTYCLEKYPLVPVREIGIPMISFCDIPISDSVEHVQKYGSYAIGLTKDSLLENELICDLISPVHYYISHTPIKPAFQELDNIRRMQKELSENYTSAAIKEQIKAMDSGDYTRVDGIPNEVVMEGFRCKKHIQQNLEATCFAIGLLKPHTSYIKRKGEEESVRQVNYDECEWRIIAPEIWDMDKGTEQSWLWSKEEYEAWRGEGLKPFMGDSKVTFSVDCISCIVVETEQEIPSFIQKLGDLDTLCEEPLSQEQKNLLFSKVISFERINKDF